MKQGRTQQLDVAGPAQETDAVEVGRGGRMSRQRKTAAVLRLLQREDLETVSRSLGVTAATLAAWRDAFLAAGEAALASRPGDGEELESQRLKAKLGEVMIERDLLHEKIVTLEIGRPCMGRRMSSPVISVRPNGAVHQWRKDPPRKLSVGPGS